MSEEKKLKVGDKGIYHPNKAKLVYPCEVTRLTSNQVDLKATVDGEDYEAVNIPIKHSLDDALKSEKRWFVAGANQRQYEEATGQAPVSGSSSKAAEVTPPAKKADQPTSSGSAAKSKE